MVSAKCGEHGLSVLEERLRYPITGPEALLAVSADAGILKRIAVSVEESTPHSRLFDIDVIDADGSHIGRSELGCSPRTCFCCNKPAVECVRSKAHDAEELDKKMERLLHEFQVAQTELWPAKLWTLGSVALEATLLEAACTPAPGLVDRVNAGAHQDMDFFTFIYGSAALAPFFCKCAALGWFHEGRPAELLPALRLIGQNGEKSMLQATAGINTQRGLLFLMGILLGGAAFLSRRGEILSSWAQLATAAAICEGIVARELAPLSRETPARKLTAGERLFVQLGETGIRGEVEAGLPGVSETGLPACGRHCLTDWA